MDQVQAKVFIKRVIPGVCSEQLEPLQVGSFHLLWLEQGPGSEVGKQSEGLQSRQDPWGCPDGLVDLGLLPLPAAPEWGSSPASLPCCRPETRPGGCPGPAGHQVYREHPHLSATFALGSPGSPSSRREEPRPFFPRRREGSSGCQRPRRGGFWLGQEDSLKGGGRQTGQRGIWVKETRHTGWGGTEQIR